MLLPDFFIALASTNNSVLPLDSEQQKAIVHNYQNPLWIIAGPGTGKTHTLSWLVIKRILVDGIDPHRIILTTFTRKAAAELRSRLILNRQKLINAGIQEAEQIDVSHLHLGTLHGICSRILQDERYDPTLRIRILEDELTQQFFVRRTNNPLLNCNDLSFWVRFDLALKRGGQQFVPNKGKKAEGICKLFNRMTENSVGLTAMLNSGDADLIMLANAYNSYQQDLISQHRTDQAHLQQHFLDFLNTPEGQVFLGNGFTVLVDEYQDTNPIQEKIYFNVAGQTCDLTVVGDDDQSLYRFRGAAVESLIDFDHACLSYFGKQPSAVYLSENRRSHPDIVKWVNRYISNHPDMHDPLVRVRAPGKPTLSAMANITGNYPAVMAIAERSNPLAATKMVGVLQELMSDQLIEDYSQVAVLTFSTRESPRQIGTFTSALNNAGIPVYNPRNGRAQNDPRFQAMLGGMIYILDPTGASPLPAQLPTSVQPYIAAARTSFQSIIDSGMYQDLIDYIDNSVQAIETAPFDPSKSSNYLTLSGGLRVTVSSLLFKLLSYQPFASILLDPIGGERLKVLNNILAQYESIYDDGQLRLEQDTTGNSRINGWALYNFYAIFVEGIHDKLNDPEDDEVSIIPGMVNIMTIHQAKGLEFEVVFVLRPDSQPFVSDTQFIEDELEPYVLRSHALQRRSRNMRAAEDTVRLFFVAFSRAKRLLILTGSSLQDWDRVLGHDQQSNPINTLPGLQSVGVHIL